MNSTGRSSVVPVYQSQIGRGRRVRVELIKELPRQQWEANAREKGKISKGEGDLVPKETPEASVAPKSYSAKEIRVPDL